MRLFELAYCCHVFALFDEYDHATAELRAATGAAVDPAEPSHQAALFTWLRRWGCRQFAIVDEDLAREGLVDWWSGWGRSLPGSHETLSDLSDAALDTIASAYDDLRSRQASWQRREGGQMIARTFGPAGAAKALFAIRPNACSPWDAPIRRSLGFSETGMGYREHLVRIQGELSEALADLAEGADASRLPALLRRSNSSLVKLVDEHDWARYTRGVEPLPVDVLQQWVVWAGSARPQTPSGGP